MEKVLLACCGLFLEEVGVESVFVENEIFGPGVVNSVLSGSNYIRAKRGMSLLSEVVQQLLLTKFITSEEEVLGIDDFSDRLKILQQTFQEANDVENSISKEWENCLGTVSALSVPLAEFVKKGNEVSLKFKFWTRFLDIVAVLRDLTSSFREGDWKLHLSAVRRAIPHFFAFDRVNYKRWVPLYYEDCLAVADKYPMLHQTFTNGRFVVAQSLR